MISSKIREAARRSCHALLHPGAVWDGRQPELSWGPRLAPIPGNASTQAFCEALRARRPLSTARPGWQYFLKEGERALSAGQLADAKVYLEHAQFIAGAEPVVQRALVILTERERQTDLHALKTRYDGLLSMADRYEAAGNLLEASCALRAAYELRPSEALKRRIESLDD